MSWLPHQSNFSSIISPHGIKPFPFTISSLAPRALPVQAQVRRLHAHLSAEMVLDLLVVFSRQTFAPYFFLWLSWVLVAAHSVFTGSCGTFCLCSAQTLWLWGTGSDAQTGMEPMSSELQDIDS